MISNNGRAGSTGRRGRPPGSERLRVEQCAEIDSLRLEHGTAWQFLPVAEILMLSRRMPDSGSDPLQCHQIEVLVEGPGSAELRPFWLTVVATRPHFGGVKQWFLCPRCDRRVRKLYCTEPRSGLACRRCLRLRYRSQFEKHPVLIAWRRHMRLLRKLRPDLYQALCSGGIQPLN